MRPYLTQSEYVEAVDNFCSFCELSQICDNYATFKSCPKKQQRDDYAITYIKKKERSYVHNC